MRAEGWALAVRAKAQRSQGAMREHREILGRFPSRSGRDGPVTRTRIRCAAWFSCSGPSCSGVPDPRDGPNLERIPPMAENLTRRQFVQEGAVAAVALASGLASASIVQAGNPTKADTSKILNYNPDMEYRHLGKTGLLVSAVALGGHWKRVDTMIGGAASEGWLSHDIQSSGFLRNRAEVVNRCIDRGINYVDACTPEEVLAYSKVLKGRRNKIYFGFSSCAQESRIPEWRPRKKLMQTLDQGMKQAGLEHVDLWRITLLEQSIQHSDAEIDDAMAALDWARKTGRARFTGISSHHRPHIKKMIERYPDQIQVILTPYTADTKVVTDEAGLWAAIKKNDVGWFGIKPFASNSLFKGDSSPKSPYAMKIIAWPGWPFATFSAILPSGHRSPDSSASGRWITSPWPSRNDASSTWPSKPSSKRPWTVPGPVCRPPTTGSATGSTCDHRTVQELADVTFTEASMVNEMIA